MSLLWKMKPRRLHSETISSMEFAGIPCPGVGKMDCAIYPIRPVMWVTLRYKRDTAENKLRRTSGGAIWSNGRARTPLELRCVDETTEITRLTFDPSAYSRLTDTGTSRREKVTAARSELRNSRAPRWRDSS